MNQLRLLRLDLRTVELLCGVLLDLYVQGRIEKIILCSFDLPLDNFSQYGTFISGKFTKTIKSIYFYTSQVNNQVVAGLWYIYKNHQLIEGTYVCNGV